MGGRRVRGSHVRRATPTLQLHIRGTRRLASALPVGLPATVVHTAQGSVGAALTVADRLMHAGQPALASAIHNAATSAYFQGFRATNYLAAGVAGAGVVMALALLPAQPTVSTDDTPGTRVLGSPAAGGAQG